jgi:hypothetical protein
MPNSVRPQDETQNWRRVRKHLASLLGDVARDNVRTWEDVKTRIEEIAVFAAEQERAWTMRIPKEDAPSPASVRIVRGREGS